MNMIQKQNAVNDVFVSSDLALVTTISLWYSIELIDRTNLSKAQFLFKRKNGLNELVASFWKRELRVEPLAFFNQLKLIKSRLYE